MKRILIIAIAALTAASSYAQSPDKALARVRYTFTHIHDTTQRDKPRTENMLLVTGKNASVYTSYDKLNQSLNMQKQVAEHIKNQTMSSDMKIVIKSEQRAQLTQNDYFFFANEHKMFTKEKLFNNYLIEEPAAEIDWKIQKDTMSFSGIPCQKAVANFKGRNWIAWFGTELPFASGPWKLNGLPGLIIEAYDEKKEVRFEFAGLENVETQQTAASDSKVEPSNDAGVKVNIVGMDPNGEYLGSEIKLPAGAIKTTRKELDKLKAAKDKDPQGFMQAQLAASGMTGSIKINSVSRPNNGVTVVKTQVNNPIELPERK